MFSLRFPVPDAPTTVLLRAARGGDREAFDRLLPRIYGDLRQIAHARLRRQRPGDTLNTTALVHEAYLRLASGEAPEWQDRAHFFALAARAMRFVLVDVAREHSAQKRGGGTPDLSLTAALHVAGPEADAHNLLTLDAALTRLAAQSERLAEVVEMRFFGGMEHAEIAEATGRSEPTIKRDWRRARAWLYAAMQEASGENETAPEAGGDDPPPADPPNGQ